MMGIFGGMDSGETGSKLCDSDVIGIFCEIFGEFCIRRL